MPTALEELLALLDLEAIEVNIFRGLSPKDRSQRVFGGQVVRADRLMHGKTSPILHDGKTLFRGMPSPFEAMRYHSLIVDRKSLPADLLVSAETPEGEVMALRHRDYPLEGVQFHPESVWTQEGKRLLTNFLDAHLPGRPARAV